MKEFLKHKFDLVQVKIKKKRKGLSCILDWWFLGNRFFFKGFKNFMVLGASMGVSDDAYSHQINQLTILWLNWSNASKVKSGG